MIQLVKASAQMSQAMIMTKQVAARAVLRLYLVFYS